MFAIIFTIALGMTYVATEIPSYIHTCGRKDPNLDQCITNSINNLKNKVCEGIPELDIPPLEPFIMDKIVISDVDNVKLYVRDSKVTGLCDYVIQFFHIDLDKLHFDINITFKQIQINGTYDFDIHVLVPFVNKGPVYITSDNIDAKVGVDLKVVTKQNQRYTYLSKVNLNLDVKTLNTKFDTNEQESSQLNEIISTFIGSNEEELIKKVKPSMEEEISKHLLLLANNVVKHFTYDELFPDQIV